MATLVLTAVGTAIGGPIGGAIGSLIGSQVDRAIIGSPKREGPRLKELEVTTSSYGTPVPRHFGTVRRAGTIVWATDLKEAKETSGGGKGKPKVTTYSYSASFAVALASRPLLSLHRIWADGNLVRGAAGDLKVGGALRFYDGHGDQPVDPLIAADRGTACPAFRGLAYAVFEDLQLEEFGNRIPALTFELVADDGEISLLALLEPARSELAVDRLLPGLGGFSDDGVSLGALLAALAPIYPLAVDAGGGGPIAISASTSDTSAALTLPPPTAIASDDAFAPQTGAAFTRRTVEASVPAALRYYDAARDYQAGIQRADGRAPAGRIETLEIPAVFDAATARGLINDAAERAGSAQQSIAWRTAELDPAIRPGAIVRVPDLPGNWLVQRWEWRDGGVELELSRQPRGPARQPPAEAGDVLHAPDVVGGPTALEVYELPWDGTGDADTRRLFAAVSSPAAGWKGAAIYLERDSELVPLGASGRARSVIGKLASGLPPSPSLLFEPHATFDVELLADDRVLDVADLAGIANGANLALVGGELLQFAGAESLGNGVWRLTGLLRGRGGTETQAASDHVAGAPFVLLDGTPLALDPTELAGITAPRLAAIGLGDDSPVYADAINPGTSLKPLAPVHPVAQIDPSGALSLCWTRRARGAWDWPDGVDAPLVEQDERYRIGVGDTDQPTVAWETAEPQLLLSPAQFADLQAYHSGEQLRVRQIGTHALSDPLLLITLP